MAATDPAPVAVIAWAGQSTTLPAAHTPGTLVRPVASVPTQPVSPTPHPRPVRSSSCGTNRGPMNTAARVHRRQLPAGMASFAICGDASRLTGVTALRSDPRDDQRADRRRAARTTSQSGQR